MSDEEAQLRRRARRRLIGAVTLVTVMVVALPMVLDGESRQSGQDIAINIPAPGSSGDFASRAAPAPVQPGPAPASPHPQAAVGPDRNASPASCAPCPCPPRVKNRQSACCSSFRRDGPGVQGTRFPAETQGREIRCGYLQAGKRTIRDSAGCIRQPTNAKERQSKLAALKVKFYTETVKTPSGDKLRVRAGPYATRQEAERVQAKLKAAGIQDGVVAEKK